MQAGRLQGRVSSRNREKVALVQEPWSRYTHVDESTGVVLPLHGAMGATEGKIRIIYLSVHLFAQVCFHILHVIVLLSY